VHEADALVEMDSGEMDSACARSRRWQIRRWRPPSRDIAKASGN